MSRLLVLGVSPLPFESSNRSFGPGTRSWQLVKPLVEDGHEVLLVGMRIPMTYPADAPAEIVTRHGGLMYSSVRPELFFDASYVDHLADEFRPDAMIFAHGGASFSEQLVQPGIPVWVDLCGHVMAEAQAKAAVYDDDSYLTYFFDKIVPALFIGDAFSTVSDAQEFALVGELGLAGRLNSKTQNVRLVYPIPCGVEEEGYTHDQTVLRDVEVDRDAFVVLWSGGFNTWSDVDTMLHGVVRAMERDPSIHFVATGGQIDGHDEQTYARFVSMVDASPHRGRFVLKGWLPKELVHNYYFEADVGINCEKDIYEVRLGSKHRVLDWSRAALPVVTTRVTELSSAIEDDGVGFVCCPGDPIALAESLLDAVRLRTTLPGMGARFQTAMRRRFGFRRTTEALREWAREPRSAPDRDRPPMCIHALVSDSRERGTPTSPGNTPGIGNPVASTDHETPFAWLLRVMQNSLKEGGLPLVARRAVDRLLGRSRP